MTGIKQQSIESMFESLASACHKVEHFASLGEANKTINAIKAIESITNALRIATNTDLEQSNNKKG